MNIYHAMPLIGCHATPESLAGVRKLYLNTERWSEMRQAVRQIVAGEHPLTGLVPGGIGWQRVSGYAPGHTAALLATFHLVEPAPETGETLVNFLRWSLEQESLILGSGLAVGQFCRGLVLALDAVGEQLPAAECRAVLEHLILCCVENLDPNDIMNHHPAGMPPLVDYLAFPGTGFHLLDCQVNNWDVISAMALFYIVRAMAVLLPERQAEAARWLELVRVRLERFFRCCFSEAGEYCEGPGYYSYGCMAAVSILDALSRWPLGKRLIETFDLRGFDTTPQWCRELFHGDLRHGHFNYNDSLRYRPERSAVVHWIAARTQNPEAQYFADQLEELNRNLVTAENQELEGNIFFCLWRDPELEARAPEGRRALCFGRTGSAVVRTGYADSDLHLIVRAGDYVGAHTHPSRGNLLLSLAGTDLLSDAGMPADRTIPAYLNYHCTTRAHNCLLIDGQGQVVARDGDYPSGRITRFAETEHGVYISADCSALYPNANLVLRDIYCSWAGWILQRDRVAGNCRQMTVLLHSAPRQGEALLDIAADGLMIRHDEAILKVQFIAGIDAAMDVGFEYHESAATGQRAVHLQSVSLESVILLAPYLAGSPQPEIQAVAENGAWCVTVNGLVEHVRLPQIGVIASGGRAGKSAA